MLFAYPAVPLILFSLTLLFPYVFFAPNYPAVPLFSLRLPCCALDFFALLLCPYFIFTYHAEPLFFFALNYPAEPLIFFPPRGLVWASQLGISITVKPKAM